MASGIGETLREAREGQGRTLEEASRATRVRVEYLRALEDEHFDVVGGDVYAKGFLSSYARWLGVDPSPLLDRYRREVQRGGYDAQALIERPVARPEGRRLPAWLVWGAVSSLVILAALGVVGIFGGRTPPAAEEPEPQVADTASPEATATETETAPAEEESPSPTPTSVRLVLLFEERCWVEASAGGEVLTRQTYEAGDSESFEAPEEIQLVLGNAGGVRIVLNGDELGSPAGRGEVWEGVCDRSDCREA